MDRFQRRKPPGHRLYRHSEGPRFRRRLLHRSLPASRGQWTVRRLGPNGGELAAAGQRERRQLSSFPLQGLAGGQVGVIQIRPGRGIPFLGGNFWQTCNPFAILEGHHGDFFSIGPES